MTQKETNAIEKVDGKVDALASAMHNYHTEVVKLVESCKPCKADVTKLLLDMYGPPGDKEKKPGLIGSVAELQRSRGLMLLALRGAWVLLTILLGAFATALLKAHI